jgi:dephospho-CoA kinase
MIRAGLTGGYATGKTFIASQFAELGCGLIHADALGHAVMEPEGEAYEPIVRRFGEEVLTPERLIDRGKLGAIVFQSPELLRELESIIHPAVFRMEEQITKDFAEREPEGILIYEAAILIETGRYKQYDRVILAIASPDVQLERGLAREGLSMDQVRARIAQQWPDEEKRKYADFVIDTSGTKQQTVNQVHRVFMELKTLAEARRGEQ